MNRFLDTLKQKTGIYKLGIDPASAAGFLVPGIFVIVVGGALSAWIIFG